jgi:hypothetical protein
VKQASRRLGGELLEPNKSVHVLDDGRLHSLGTACSERNGGETTSVTPIVAGLARAAGRGGRAARGAKGVSYLRQLGKDLLEVFDPSLKIFPSEGVNNPKVGN